VSKITHASLFSGIGAVDLAAQQLGIRNVFNCEINPFCRTVLDYWFKESIGYTDVRTVDFTRYRGQITILSGGFPCQPFSLAGQRRGTEDLRFLWPEMLRAIKEIRPAYVLGENVPGILTDVQPGSESAMETEKTLFGESHYTVERGQFVVERICQDFEREGYSIIPLVIPACAVGAPHRRDRVWFIAKRIDDDSIDGRPWLLRWDGAEETVHERRPLETGHAERASSDTDGYGHSTPEARGRAESHGRDIVLQQGERRDETQRTDGLPALQRPAANAECRGGNEGRINVQPEVTDGERATGDGMQRIAAYAEGGRSGRLRVESQEERTRGGNELLGERGGLHDEGLPADFWRDFPTTQPIIRRGDDGLSQWMDSLAIPYPKWRAEAVKAYGNSMCEPLVKELLMAIVLDIENDRKYGDKR